VDGLRVERGRPLRPGQHRRRQGAVHWHLPAGRWAARRREARAAASHQGQRGDHRRAAAADPDEPAARPRGGALPGALARRRARSRRAREPLQVRAARTRRPRPDDGRQDRAHVARGGRPELHGRGLGLPLQRARARAARARPAGAAPAVGGAPDRPAARRHQRDRRIAARGGASQPAGDAGAARARGREHLRCTHVVPGAPNREGTPAWQNNCSQHPTAS